MSYTEFQSPRHRSMTEKGRMYQIELLKSKKQKLQRQVEKTVQIIDEHLKKGETSQIKEFSEKLSVQFDELMEIHGKFQVLTEGDELRSNEENMDNLDRKVYTIKRKIQSLSSNKDETGKLMLATGGKKEIGSKTSTKSKASSRGSSRASSTLDLKVKEEKAKLAELAIQQSFLKKKKEAELAAQQLEVEMEIAKATAKLKVYETEEEDEEMSSLGELENVKKAEDRQRTIQDYVDLHRKHQPFGNAHDEFYVKDQWPDYTGELKPKETQYFESSKYNVRPDEIRKQVFPSRQKGLVPGEEQQNIFEMLNYMQAPEVEIDRFDGDPLEFLYFINNFQQAVETKIRDERGRLRRLLKFLSGEPKELIKSCVYLPSDRCYTTAKGLLEKNYGNPHQILSAFRNQSREWPKLKPNDSLQYKQFHSFLVKFKSTMVYSGNSWFDSPDIIQVLQSKLPLFLQDKWNRQAFKIRTTKGTEARMSDFIAFIDTEVQIVTDPLYSREASNTERDLHQVHNKSKKNMKSFGIGTPQTCLCCNGSHDLDDCIDYLKKPLEKRRKFLFENRLCFACYQPTSDKHNAKSCKDKRKCHHCEGNHPSGLHGYRKSFNNNKEKEEKPGNLKSAYAKVQAEVVSLCVVPVTIMHCDTKKKVSTYALLDTGSQGTFIKDELLQTLGVKGTETSISITTIAGKVNEKCKAIDGLSVKRKGDTSRWIDLPRTFTQSHFPVDDCEVPTPRKIQKWNYLDRIQSHIPQNEEKVNVMLLIGGNCPVALEPVEVIKSQKGGPYAVRTILGWCITGPILSQPSSSTKCNLIATRDVSNGQLSPHHFVTHESFREDLIRQQLKEMYQLEFVEQKTETREEYSIEDKKFLALMDKEVKMVDDHYELPLPLRETVKSLPNNKLQVRNRMNGLKKRLQKDPKMLSHYQAFMVNMFEKGYARRAKPTTEKTWFTPHFGVYHPAKPEKIRVVFNFSAITNGTSLNEHLMQGPDLTNDLLRLLIRFRQEEIAIMADVESMFHQVKVAEKHMRYLRFFWWPGGNLEAEMEEYEMTVHTFGAVSSPSCANYCLKKTACDNEKQFGKEVADTLRRNFYVDDMAKSVSTPSKAIELLQNVMQMSAAGGFPLGKIISNCKEVLNAVPVATRAKSIKSIDLRTESLPVERALGVHWNVETDHFGFKVDLKPLKETRRGILSSVASVYDPLGFVAPFLLKGRQILQELCAEKKDWDDDLSDHQLKRWRSWRSELDQLEKISIPRCYKPANFGKIVHASIHHFSDASDSGYGTASYLRLQNENGQISCRLLIGKSRVAPLKLITIPRMELTAAVLSIKMSKFLQKELEIKCEEYFWTDSQVVLCYLRNEARQYKLFVANRVTTILEHSKLNQWKYVPSSDNPADDASRGLSIKKYLKNRRWLEGPLFLYQQKESWPAQTVVSVKEENLELKGVKVNTTKVSEDFLSHILKLTSRWYRLKRIIATVMKWRLKRTITTNELQDAEMRIIRLLQQSHFQTEVNDIKHQSTVKKSSSLRKLDPFLDDHGVLRVGGRISKSSYTCNIVHPIILPKSDLTKMIVRACHERVAHSGRGLTINKVRNSGYWVLSCNSFVRQLISKCVTCRIQRGVPAQQKMANLPSDRLEEVPPFTNCGVDLFGPFIIRERRKELKRYGTLFTCLVSRAVHIESVNSLETDSFILALRRFIARRGHIRLLRCDNGSNFIGAEAELRAAWNQMDQVKVDTFLQQQGGDLIKWQHNPPKASHFGGIWERQIRSARSILSSLLRTHGESLNDESFRTLLHEVENIINSRPLTFENLSDPGSPLPLSPMNLLTMKSKIVLPPPGEFQQADLYCRRRWRRIQHISNEFWTRWQKEYVQTLQQRSKWFIEKRNLQVGDVVLIKEKDMIRNNWKLAKIIEKHTSKDGNVRSCVLVTSTGQKLSRPIQKLILLLERFPDEEPTVE